MNKGALPAIRVRAHAKINLNLRVGGLRADGYHDLRTVFQALALHDTLTFVARPGPFGLESSDARLPADPGNLIWRAADLVWQHLRRDGPVRDVAVRIEKRIPMRAGLGGGSADAAAALLGFARLWDPQLPPADLAALGRRLGADVGFFFTGGAALGLGRGDEIYPLADLPRLGVLLVVPAFEVATADAYRWLDDDRERGRAGETTSECTDSHVGATWGAGRRTPDVASALRIPRSTWPPPACEIANDFQPVVTARHPEIAEIVRALIAAGAAAAAMTGSGSTVFGLFDQDEVLAAAAQVLDGFGHSIERTRTLPRREYLRASTPVVVRRVAHMRNAS
jgi:4-diphosphocytidyl-2-C-methyl-D-erythritol kinase